MSNDRTTRVFVGDSMSSINLHRALAGKPGIDQRGMTGANLQQALAKPPQPAPASPAPKPKTD